MGFPSRAIRIAPLKFSIRAAALIYSSIFAVICCAEGSSNAGGVCAETYWAKSRHSATKAVRRLTALFLFSIYIFLVNALPLLSGGFSFCLGNPGEFGEIFHTYHVDFALRIEPEIDETFA